MTDQELQETLNKMERLFSDLPNPLHEPVRFAFYVKLYKYYYCSEGNNQSASDGFQ